MMELDLVLVCFCFLEGKQWPYEISILFVCPPFQLLIQLMDLQESWNKRYVTGGHPSTILSICDSE